MTRRFIFALGVVLCVVAIWLFVFYLPSPPVKVTSTTLQSAVGCDFSEDQCVRNIGDTVYRLTGTPSVFKVETPMTFTLQSTALSALSSVEGHLEGRDMYMGKIPLFFTYQNGKFVAQTMVGACTESSMIWTMHLAIEQPNGSVEQLTFDLQSVN